MRVVDETVERDAVPEVTPATVAPVPGRRRGRVDLAAYASFVGLAWWVLGRLWINPTSRVLAANDDDHGVFLFFVTHGERVLFHGAALFHSDRLNVPDGVNMMANTSILALSLPVAPITHWWGAGVSVALLLTLGLVGTATAWYVVLTRHLVRSRAAGYVGALWCGFAPTMVSHASGHINFVSQFVVPFIGWQALRLREPGRVFRSGVPLGLLIVLQLFINEETLLFTALTLGAFVTAYAIGDRRTIRAVGARMAAGVAVAAGVAGVLLAYPLWVQFFGPGSYHGQPFPPDQFVTDLLSVGAFPRQSLAGSEAVAQRLSVSATEDNTFFGVPVLIMLAVAMVILRRSVAAWATAVAGLALLVASLGPRLRVAGHDTVIPLPFGLVSHVPIIDLVSVTRFAMATATVVGVLLALAADRMIARRRDAGPRDAGSASPAGGYPRRVRVAFWVALVAALLPLTPTPLPVVAATPLPAFIADGTWRRYVPADRSLVPVPLPDVTTGRDGMRWMALSGGGFAVPRGYFMGPVNPPTDDTGSWSAPRRPTADLLSAVLVDGHLPAITAADRQAAIADLIYWRAAVVVLGEHPYAPVLAQTVTDLLGRTPQRIGGVLLWDVRDLPVPPR